jgi:dipeptidyl aminopeptidase/acylaminoacyl peptidase
LTISRYGALQPDFRGSLGYGKKYLFAGNKEWSLKMHDDLIVANCGDHR